MDLHALVAEKSLQIEAELRRLGYWQHMPLPRECYVNMGAFGENTMSFEQWLQFILIPRIQEIVSTGGDFPTGSELAPYAIRVWDGNPDTDTLHTLLYELDRLVNRDKDGDVDFFQSVEERTSEVNSTPDVVSVDDTVVPPVLYTLADVLPLYSINDLEAQLQTFDTFLEFLSATVRPEISKILNNAATACTDMACRQCIEEAAASVLKGGRAAAPYNHEEAMKKYREEHDKSFPKNK